MSKCVAPQTDLLAQRFRSLGHVVRLRIMGLLLSHQSGLCVCEVADVLGLPQYMVSRHLKALTEAGLVNGQHDGPWVYYVPVRDPLLQALESQLRCSADDKRRLGSRLALREGGRCVVGPQGEANA